MRSGTPLHEYLRLLMALLACLLLPATARATNGLNLIGSGGISSALAGADTALATDFTAMNTNPAGMSQIAGSHAGLSVSIFVPQLRHKDALNDRAGEDQPLVIPNTGYIRRLAGTPVTLGIGFFTIGGNASDFRDLGTQFGTTDKTSIFLRQYKLAPSISYAATDKLSVGASLALTYSDISVKVLPNTAVPGVFAGFETDGACERANALSLPASCGYAFGVTPKVGLMYKPNEVVTLGIAYTFKTILPYANMKLTRNLGGAVGKVKYDADISGFKWSDDLAVGIALRPTNRWLIAAKFQWINWDAALNNVTINLKNGDNPAAPTGSINLTYNWRDQYVVAVGAAYDVTDQVNLHGGYNYGNNPVPKSTLDPTNANIVEHHIAAGVSYKPRPSLLSDLTFTYWPSNEITYNSAIYGNNSSIRVGAYEFLLTVSWWPGLTQ